MEKIKFRIHLPQGWTKMNNQEYEIVFALTHKDNCAASSSFCSWTWAGGSSGDPTPGTWTMTSACQQSCSCPVNIPTRGGNFNGEVLSYQCVTSCPEDCLMLNPPQTCCYGVCVNLTSDFYNCGGCDIGCFEGETCCNSFCIQTASFQTDDNNCGSCGNKCAAGYKCCSGSCVNVMGSDVNNCGNCDFPCPYGDICLNGLCKDPCAVNSCEWTWTSSDPPCGCCYEFTCVWGDVTTYYQKVTKITPSNDPEACEGASGECITCGVVDDPNTCKDVKTYNYSNSPCVIECCETHTCVNNNGNMSWQTTRSPSNSYGNCGSSPYVPCSGPSDAGNAYQTWTTSSEGDYALLCAYPPCPQSSNGSWGQTQVCPQGCNCPIVAPTITGYSNQKVSSECVSCFPACDPANEECCNGVCKHILTDNNNCGTCGIVCQGIPAINPKSCCSGNCCPLGSCCQVGGEDTCVDLLTDRANCGTCGNACAGNRICCNGVCKSVEDLNIDESNCGTCGNVCAAGETCCFGSCKNLKSNLNNCGTCGNACPQGWFCTNGVCSECVPACVDGRTCCNTICVDTTSDNDNCSTCGLMCPFGYHCLDSTCVACSPFCSQGQACCGGVCINLGTNQNCASCGNVCGSGTKCCGGFCVSINNNPNCGDCGITCTQGQDCCNGVCKSITNDPDNCGYCGNVCYEDSHNRFTVPRCALGVCIEQQCQCSTVGMPQEPGPIDVFFESHCSGNYEGCTGDCYFNAVGSSWVLYTEGNQYCGKKPQHNFCVEDKKGCVEDKYICVMDKV